MIKITPLQIVLLVLLLEETEISYILLLIQYCYQRNV